MARKPRKPKPADDLFYAHEALDRASIAAAFFDENVTEHPYVQANPKLRRKAQRLAEELGMFYQDVGQFWAALIERTEKKSR